MTMTTAPAPHRAPEEPRRPTREGGTPGLVLSRVRPTTARPAMVVAALAGALALVLRLALGVHVAAAVALAFGLYLVVVYAVYAVLGGRRVAQDQLVRGLVYIAFVLAVVPLLSLLWTVVAEGVGRAFDPAFLNQTMNGVTGLHDQHYVEGTGSFVGGAYHAIVGTLIITGLATLISVPVGMLTAIYLVEYGGRSRLSRTIRFFVDVMTGIPSIVAGLFAFALFVQVMGPRDAKMGIAGAVALSVLMIPTVVRNSEEMLRVVPHELREASLALGATRFEMIGQAVMPFARAGIISSVMLALGRALGETMAVALVLSTGGLQWSLIRTGNNTIAAEIAHVAPTNATPR